MNKEHNTEFDFFILAFKLLLLTHYSISADDNVKVVYSDTVNNVLA